MSTTATEMGWNDTIGNLRRAYATTDLQMNERISLALGLPVTYPDWLDAEQAEDARMMRSYDEP
jgi:hypothetical protein